MPITLNGTHELFNKSYRLEIMTPHPPNISPPPPFRPPRKNCTAGLQHIDLQYIYSRSTIDGSMQVHNTSIRSSVQGTKFATKCTVYLDATDITTDHRWGGDPDPAEGCRPHTPLLNWVSGGAPTWSGAEPQRGHPSAVVFKAQDKLENVSRRSGTNTLIFRNRNSHSSVSQATTAYMERYAIQLLYGLCQHDISHWNERRAYSTQQTSIIG